MNSIEGRYILFVLTLPFSKTLWFSDISKQYMGDKLAVDQLTVCKEKGVSHSGELTRSAVNMLAITTL